MAHSPLVFDIETQHTFQEVSYDFRKLKVSVVGTYDCGTGEYKAFFEKDLPELFTRMEYSSLLIGFNSNKFDLPVLAPYYIGNVAQFSSLDILEEIEKALGFRLALDVVAKATLGIRKTGHGLQAIDFYKNGELDKLKEYCLHDVKITKELYEFGLKQRKLYFDTNRGIKEFPVNFEKSNNNQTTVSLSLPF